jgi:hypothetical protein
MAGGLPLFSEERLRCIAWFFSRTRAMAFSPYLSKCLSSARDRFTQPVTRAAQSSGRVA